jgi:hypothetical protein
MSWSGYPQRRGTASSVSPLAAMALAPPWIGWTVYMMALTVAVACVVPSFGWLLTATTFPRLKSKDSMPEVEDPACQHLKRMIINSVVTCPTCGVALWSGRCERCHLPMDDHNGFLIDVPQCPQPVIAP